MEGEDPAGMNDYSLVPLSPLPDLVKSRAWREFFVSVFEPKGLISKYPSQSARTSGSPGSRRRSLDGAMIGCRRFGGPLLKEPEKWRSPSSYILSFTDVGHPPASTALAEPRFAPVFWVSSSNTSFRVCPDTSFTVLGYKTSSGSQRSMRRDRCFTKSSSRIRVAQK